MIAICQRKTLKLLLSLLFSFSTQAFGQTQFCLDQRVNLASAKKYLQQILTDSDKVYLRESNHCLEINVRPEREELVVKFLEREFGPVKVLSDNQPHHVYEECLFELVETTDMTKQTNDIRIGQSNVLRQQNENSNGKVTSTLKLATNRWGAITVDENQADLRCLKRGARYEIEVRIASQNGFVSTVLEVTKNQSVDLGQMVQDLKDKNRELSTSTGIQLQKVSGQKNKRYSLTLR